MEKQTRSILAILSTDIPGYTEKIEEDESQAFRLIAKHRDIINKHVNTSNGLMFKEMGDGTFSKFDSAIDASHCAIKIQSEAIDRDLPLRIGIHLGDLLQEGEDFLGSGINIADRIQKLAETGKIYISDDIWRQIKNQPDLKTNEIGQHVLRGTTGKMTLHELVFNVDGTITEKIEFTHKIQVQDEEGKKVEKETPKNEYLKTMTMFCFDNETNDPDLDWLQHGISFACNYTLNQEKLLDIYSPLGHTLIEKSEYEYGIGMPNPLKKKISNLSDRHFWFSGKIISHENEYFILTELYDAKHGKLIEKREFTGDDMFKLIDNLSLQLRYDLGIPASHIESTECLPLSDIYTNSMKAFEYYVKGRVANLGYDSTSSEDYYNKALTEDKNFALIHYTLSDLHLENEALDKLTESLNNAMSLLYKFPESIQYQVKNRYFRFIEKNPDKLLKLNMLWTKLNPNSIEAHSQLGHAYYMSEDLDNALKSVLVVYNMDMSSFSNLIHVIDIHKRRKNYEEAIMLLTKFCNNYPDNHRSYLALGRLYEAMGDFHKAKDQFETASLLEPNNNFIKLRLCNLETKFGNFDSAINQLIILDKDPRKTSDEKYEIYRALSLIYKKLGQIKTSIKYVEKMYALGFL